jgi:hypothetical protein
MKSKILGAILLLMLVFSTGTQGQEITKIFEENFESGGDLTELGFEVFVLDRVPIIEINSTAAFEGTAGLFIQSEISTPGGHVIIQKSLDIDLSILGTEHLQFSIAINNQLLPDESALFGMIFESGTNRFALQYGNPVPNNWQVEEILDATAFSIETSFPQAVWINFNRSIHEDLTIAFEHPDQPELNDFPDKLSSFFIIHNKAQTQKTFIDNIRINQKNDSLITNTTLTSVARTNQTTGFPLNLTGTLGDWRDINPLAFFAPPVIILTTAGIMAYKSRTRIPKPKFDHPKKVDLQKLAKYINHLDVAVYSLKLQNQSENIIKAPNINIISPKVGYLLSIFGTKKVSKESKKKEDRSYVLSDISKKQNSQIILIYIHFFGSPKIDLNFSLNKNKLHNELTPGQKPIKEFETITNFDKLLSAKQLALSIELFAHIQDNIQRILTDTLKDIVKDQLIKKYMKDWKYHSFFIENTVNEEAKIKIKPAKGNKIISVNTPNDIKLIEDNLELKLPNTGVEGFSISFIEVGLKGKIGYAELITGSQKTKLPSNLPYLNKSGFQIVWLNNFANDLSHVISDLLNKVKDEADLENKH